MDSFVEKYDTMGIIFLQKKYFEEESKANWWCNAITSDDCEKTNRRRYKYRYFDQHSEINYYKKHIVALKK